MFITEKTELFLVIRGEDEGQIGELIDHNSMCGKLKMENGRKIWYRWTDISLKPLDNLRKAIMLANQRHK